MARRGEMPIGGNSAIPNAAVVDPGGEELRAPGTIQTNVGGRFVVNLIVPGCVRRENIGA